MFDLYIRGLAYTLIIYSVQQKAKSKNMDSTIPISANISRGAPFPPMGQPMGQGFPAPLVPAGAMRPPFMQSPIMNPIEASVKATEFAKGVYVSGFEKTLTAEMLQQHFKIKPIAALKLPFNKYRQNKGFAFIYYQSVDDATYVKQRLDYTVILRNKIRVTKAVSHENLSKMMFKLKTTGLNQQQIKNIKQKYFNQRNLEREVSKIIAPSLKDSVEINKIIIPSLKVNGKTVNNGQTLDYARVFFHVSQLKQASRNINLLNQLNPDNNTKKDYELILNFIVEKLNSDPEFSSYVKAEVYDYSSKNKTNIFHIKYITGKPDENPEKIAEELKQTIQENLRQSKISQVFVGAINKKVAWANVSFSSVAEAQEAYKFFKEKKIKFRDTNICGTLSNVKDLRTVVISTVKNEANQQQIRAFLNKLAQRSPRYDFNDETKGRKYEFIGFSILEKKTYYHISSDAPSIGLRQDEQPKESWIQQNQVPRRIVIDFEHDLSDRELKQLQIDIKTSEDFDKIFIQKDLKHQVRAGHQKGHYKSFKYIKHIEQQKKKNDGNQQMRQMRPRPTGPKNNFNQFNFKPNQNRPPRNIGAPTRGPFNPSVRQGFRPMGQMGPIPSVGGMVPPKIGQVPTPVMGGLQVPPMGLTTKAPTAMIPMGGMPPPMGLPAMTGLPPMGFQVPQMGVPKMGVPQQNIPLQDKKQ